MPEIKELLGKESLLAIKDYIDNNKSDIEQDLLTKEDKSNKVTSLSDASTDTQYPSAKAVYTYVDTELTNVAYKDKANRFVAKQTISANGSDTPLDLNTFSNASEVYAGFYINNQPRGWVGVKDYKPYFVTANASIKPSGEIALMSDINNATLTIKNNNTSVGTFTANASSNVDINIETPQIMRFI